LLLTLTALGLLLVRRHSILDQWLMVVLLAWLPTYAVAALFPMVQFTLGWYVSRAFALLAGSSLLFVLLTETVGLHKRLAKAIVRLRRVGERQRSLVDALNRREAGLQEALAVGSVIAFEWDATSDLVRRSNNAAQVLGIDLKLIPTSASFRERVHPDDRERLMAVRSNADPDNATYSTTCRFMRPDGQEIWLHEISKAEFDSAGRLIRVKGLARDITVRKHAEERDALLRLAQVSTGVGVWGCDMRTKELSVPPELEELFGLKAANMKNYADFRNLVHPEDIEYVEANRDAAIQRHERFHHEFRIIHPSGEMRWMSSTGRAVYDEITGEPLRVLGINFDITERKRAEERQELLVAELDHRVKNILAQVAVVAASTRQGSRSIDEFLGSLDGRIQSMATAHTLLGDSNWERVCLGTLVRSQLAPYATDTNVTVSGADVMLKSAETQAFARVLHELATNAAKYGALSSPGGQVSVSWDLKPNGAATDLILVWREFGGPAVAPEHPTSYGTNLIRNLIPHELGGSVDLVFAAKGVNCRIEIPISRP
jgi:PAS domain S-box-containing protein